MDYYRGGFILLLSHNIFTVDFLHSFLLFVLWFCIYFVAQFEFELVERTGRIICHITVFLLCFYTQLTIVFTVFFYTAILKFVI